MLSGPVTFRFLTLQSAFATSMVVIDQAREFGKGAITSINFRRFYEISNHNCMVVPITNLHSHSEWPHLMRYESKWIKVIIII